MKYFCLLLMMMLCIMLAACGSAPAEAASPSPAAIEAAPAPTVRPAESVASPTVIPGGEGDILDLTSLGATMVYAEVYSMMYYPEDYADRLIRMSGQLSVYEDPDSGKQYFACVIADAAACCQQGMEFVPADGSAQLPEPGAEITVTGRFSTYSEGEYLYCHLTDAEVLAS